MNIMSVVNYISLIDHLKNVLQPYDSIYIQDVP